MISFLTDGDRNSSNCMFKNNKFEKEVVQVYSKSKVLAKKKAEVYCAVIKNWKAFHFTWRNRRGTSGKENFLFEKTQKAWSVFLINFRHVGDIIMMNLLTAIWPALIAWQVYHTFPLTSPIINSFNFSFYCINLRNCHHLIVPLLLLMCNKSVNFFKLLLWFDPCF